MKRTPIEFELRSDLPIPSGHHSHTHERASALRQMKPGDCLVVHHATTRVLNSIRVNTLTMAKRIAMTANDDRAYTSRLFTDGDKGLALGVWRTA